RCSEKGPDFEGGALFYKGLAPGNAGLTGGDDSLRAEIYGHDQPGCTHRQRRTRFSARSTNGSLNRRVLKKYPVFVAAEHRYSLGLFV
ncbi:hypothetical protein, partial [Brevundimonas sp.]|uniref:hypothetical protein n=1 Tax=Brevundimonas sp. TaxID=1871086 RepID=UPI00391B2F8A